MRGYTCEGAQGCTCEGVHMLGGTREGGTGVHM